MSSADAVVTGGIFLAFGALLLSIGLATDDKP